MNHLYKVIWSKSKACYVVVSEIAGNAVHNGNRRHGMRGILSAFVLCSLLSGGFLANEAAAADMHYVSIQSDNSDKYSNYENNGVKSKEGVAIGVGASVGKDGKKSVAMGYTVSAKGKYSTAMGVDTFADGDCDVAVGYGSSAKGTYSSAFGMASHANGRSSTSVGNNNSADGFMSNAVGHGNTAKGQEATAIGSDNEAIGKSSFAGGVESISKGAYSAALGVGAVAEKDSSFALGSWAHADEEGSVALGSESKADRKSGVFGYNPLTGKAYEETAEEKTARDHWDKAYEAWNTDQGNEDKRQKLHEARDAYNKMVSSHKSTRAAVSVGDESLGISRQITGVSAGSADTDAVNVAQLKSLDERVKAAEIEARKHPQFISGKNLKISPVAEQKNGGKTFKVSLADDIDLGLKGSISAGGMKLNENGMDAGGKKLANVGRGEADGDAVNMAQLNELKNEVGQKMETDLKASRVSVKEGKNVIINRKQSINGTEYTIHAKDTYTTGGTYDAAGKKLIFTQNDSTKNYEVDVSGLVSGISGDINKGLDFVGDTGKAINRKMGERLEILGGAKELSEKNIGVVSQDGRLHVKLAKELHGLENVETKGIKAQNGTISRLSADKIRVGHTEITEDGVAVENGPALTKKGISGGNRVITDVADGQISSESTDAVNGRQIYGLKQEANAQKERMDSLQGSVDVNERNIRILQGDTDKMNGRIDHVNARVDRVGAGAAALAALRPMSSDPGSGWSFAAGYGRYHGANATAVGASYSPNETTVFSLGGSFGGGENMMNAGVAVKLGQGGSGTASRTELARSVKELKEKNEKIQEQNHRILEENKEMKEELAMLKSQMAGLMKR